MQGQKNIGKKGISPLIASVFSLMFGVMMLTIVLTVIQPTFQRAQDSSRITDIIQNLQLLDSVIEEVSSEAEGSRRTVPFSASGGEYRINATNDWLYAVYEPKSDMILDGSKADIKIKNGLEFMDDFNWYIDGSDGSPVWTTVGGTWSVSSLRYLGHNGSAYINITPRPIERFEFSGKITNISGPAGGQIFVIPTAAESLVGFWAFGSGSGDKAYDYSGNNNTGTLTNMNTTGNSTSGWQSTSACKAGSSCLMFDGTNDYVEVPYDASLKLGNTGTVALWVKPSSLPSGTHALVLYGDQATYQNGYLINQAGTTLSLYWRSASPSIGVSNVFQVGQWTHIAFVNDNGNLRAYVDGEYANIGSSGGSITNNYATRIGAASSNWRFNGIIDEVMVFDQSMTADEVAALYETSAKTLQATGSQSISPIMRGTLILSNPAGQSQFDDITITREKKEISFIIPYSNVDLNGTFRLGKGERLITVSHMGVNTTSNRPMVEIRAS